MAYPSISKLHAVLQILHLCLLPFITVYTAPQQINRGSRKL